MSDEVWLLAINDPHSSSSNMHFVDPKSLEESTLKLLESTSPVSFGELISTFNPDDFVAGVIGYTAKTIDIEFPFTCTIGRIVYLYYDF